MERRIFDNDGTGLRARGAFSLRARGIHRGHPGQARAVSGGPRRYALSGRNRRHLPAEIRESSAAEALADFDTPERYAALVSPETERGAIVAALEEAGGIRTQAARILGMGRTTLWRKLKEYGIESEEGS